LAQDFAKKFYKSKAWERARELCISRSHGLCERCARLGKVRVGVIVHHKEHLTPSNINDVSISLGQENLELVCRKCHAEVHPEIYGKEEVVQERVAFDEFGNLVMVDG